MSEQPFHLDALLPEGWRDAVYEPFRDGVEISPIVTGEPAVALTLMLNPEGSEHSVWSVTGCVVLIQWAKPVEFIGAE